MKEAMVPSQVVEKEREKQEMIRRIEFLEAKLSNQRDLEIQIEVGDYSDLRICSRSYATRMHSSNESVHLLSEQDKLSKNCRKN